MEYHLSYLRAIISKAFRQSFNYLGIGSQIIIDVIFYWYYRNRASSQLGDFMLGISVVVGVFMIIFLVNLIWEFRWAIPNIEVAGRGQLVENGNVMVVFDVYNNELDPLTECYFKLNKFTVFYLDKNTSKNDIPKNVLEKFNWQSGEEKIEIPSLESRTVQIARENPELSDEEFRLVYGPVIKKDETSKDNFFLRLCTNYGRLIYPDTRASSEFFVVYLKFEGELRGVLGEKRMFPKKIYGRIIFKKTGGLEIRNGRPISVRPTTWLDLEKIRSWQMKNP